MPHVSGVHFGARAISVGRRLTFLVTSEIATALVLLFLGFVALQSLASSTAFMHRFVLVPIQELGSALDDVGRLGGNPPDPAGDEGILRRLDAFADHYRREIQVEGNSGPDARRQTSELRKLGRLYLVGEEKNAVASIQDGLRRMSAGVSRAGVSSVEVDRLRADLRDLLRINLQFVDAAQDDISTSVARTGATLVSVGLLGIGLAGALGWRVRSAIAPRISALVREIRKFIDHGVLDRAQIQGDDDIAVLGNALDVGFAAIVERNSERERFLAVVAHELKTPLVSILGFAQAALANPANRERAFEVIRRQTRRLGHLIEDLIWAASVRTGELPFRPVPLDIAEVARRLADEVGDSFPAHPIAVEGPPTLCLLADETLIAHALWSLLSYAELLSAPDAPIELGVVRSGARVSVILRMHGSSLLAEDQVRLFEPFSMLRFEGDSLPRSPMGLFLCREIARVHGGSLRFSERVGVGPILTLDLPA